MSNTTKAIFFILLLSSMLILALPITLVSILLRVGWSASGFTLDKIAGWQP